MRIKNFKCPQCGSSDFEKESKNRMRCAYCNSLFETSEEHKSSGSKVIIKKGAKVVFGKNANVVIKGALEIEDGADVTINGKITLIQSSDKETVELAKKKLKKIEEK